MEHIRCKKISLHLLDKISVECYRKLRGYKMTPVYGTKHMILNFISIHSIEYLELCPLLCKEGKL